MPCHLCIYILLSIKTRIETCFYLWHVHANIIFISYYPLKQGLKLLHSSSISQNGKKFISYYPLKQGLKQGSGNLSDNARIDLYPTIH